jgi:hypothetical protein
LEGCNPLVCSLNEVADFHAMSNEDEFIYEIFYTNPINCRVIVEVGGGNGDHHSFSHFFEEVLNWRSSLLIEANVDLFQQLKANRANATTINGTFCKSSRLHYTNQAFTAPLGGGVEISYTNCIHLYRPELSSRKYCAFPAASHGRDLAVDPVYSDE